MFSLPQRPGPYLIALLLIILGVLSFWMLKVLNDPAIQQAVQKNKSPTSSLPPQPTAPLAVPAPPPLSDQPIDPAFVQMHEEMLLPETPPERELEILQELMTLHQKAMKDSSFGDNADVTQALVGQSVQGVWLPRQSPRIQDGRLLDRWGTPYWFHANTGSQVEIRSAGPDRNLFSPDDIILNGSPAGFGATPAQP